MLLKNTSQVKNSIPEKVQVGCKSFEISQDYRQINKSENCFYFEF